MEKLEDTQTEQEQQSEEGCCGGSGSCGCGSSSKGRYVNVDVLMQIISMLADAQGKQCACGSDECSESEKAQDCQGHEHHEGHASHKEGCCKNHTEEKKLHGQCCRDM